jgi:hypothetical protein
VHFITSGHPFHILLLLSENDEKKISIHFVVVLSFESEYKKSKIKMKKKEI